jgi:acetyl-CoA carboxylase biotin carboxyl carrier protein
MEIALKQLKSLLKTLEEGGASEFEYRDEKYRIKIRIGQALPPPGPVVTSAGAAAASAAPAAVTAVAAPEQDPSVVFVTSPFVGTFYRAPNPESPVFAEVGVTVRKGQTLCIVEAMKLMNEIESEYDGTVLEILVDNGHSVEFGQKLFKLKRS